MKLVAEKNIHICETALDLALKEDKHDIVYYFSELNVDTGCCF